MYLGGEEKENNCSLGGGGEKENNNYGWGEEQKENNCHFWERRRITVVIWGEGNNGSLEF